MTLISIMVSAGLIRDRVKRRDFVIWMDEPGPGGV